jgi:hypothetical protein
MQSGVGVWGSEKQDGNSGGGGTSWGMWETYTYIRLGREKTPDPSGLETVVTVWLSFSE